MTLVLELADKVNNLKQVVDATGLEWLAEWDIDFGPDEDFPASGSKTRRDGRLFVSMVNQQGMERLLALWNKWRKDESLPHGQTVWKGVFRCLKTIRRWGIEETLDETGMSEYFENQAEEEASFQIECFYHQNPEKRRKVERQIHQLVGEAGGQLISKFIDMSDIAFHAAKAQAFVSTIRELLGDQGHYNLFSSPDIMYFRQTGQSIASTVEADGEEAQYPEKTMEAAVAAILDGVPNLKHQALDGNIIFDDPFDLAGEYQPGERRHGTAMASLILHGDRADETARLLATRLHHVAIMQPDPEARNMGRKVEHFPEECFYEDRIEKAVRRILEKDGDVPAQAPGVKIINLSLGDDTRPFIHSPSPWARLLDWLSWKYRILFCVSAGNYSDGYDFGIPYSEYATKPPEDKTEMLLQHKHNTLSERRLLAPAESINSLTVGALHQDSSGDNFDATQRIDLLPNNQLPSPVSRLGHGFRRSVKPEIYFPGGRQLYRKQDTSQRAQFEIDPQRISPGQKVAWDNGIEGKLSTEVFSRGTSNAAALATRAGVQIHQVLDQLNQRNNDQIPNENMAVLIKTLLVHGSVQNREAQEEVIKSLKNSNNSRDFKTVAARHLGYGNVDVERVLGCTEQRGTVIGCGEITTDGLHEYRFPIPGGFSGQRTFRRMVVTLAWFSPVNMWHRYIREAKLEVKPVGKWGDSPLKVSRTDGDHNQVKRGTVQHEVLEGETAVSAFQKGEDIVLQVVCKKDATDRLEDKIPYGLAVTLEAAEGSGILVYDAIRQRLLEQVEVVVE